MNALQARVDESLADIAGRVEAGERLRFDDGVRLYRTPHLHSLGILANAVRERWHGNVAFYNVNRHINYTNYCVLRCKFCSFYRPYPARRNAQPPFSADGEGGSEGCDSHPHGNHSAGVGLPLPLLGPAAFSEDDTYELRIDEIVARTRHAYGAGATEVHIVGGLHPRLPFSYYIDVCAAIRAACPRIHIKAFTAIEIIHFTRISRPRLSIRDVLIQLREAGLGSLPGGGAEIFDDRVHAEAYKNKVGEAGWFDVHRTAHELGIFTNATMLYGHIERPEERITHLIKLREHQDDSLRQRAAQFNCCIPLSFIPEGSELSHLPGPTGLDDLRTLAISRLMLDNIPHIKAFWIMQSAKLAQVALQWGCDDMDGTVGWYDITKREAGAGNRRQELTVEQMRRLIREAGRIPVERDTLYRPVIRERGTWRVEPDSPLQTSRAAAALV